MNTHKWGLVLSGGGGKGSYQLGVYRALIETGLFSCINGISGTSIGAINAALFAMNNYDNALKAWSSIKPDLFLSPITITSAQIPDIITQNVITHALDNGIFSRSGLEKLLNDYVDFNRLSACPYAIYANAVTGTLPGERVRYFALNDRTPSLIKQIILASSALPYIYEPVEIEGELYRDGGLLDNVPVKPLVELGLKHIIVVRLEEDEHIPLSYKDSADYIDIEPSREIGDFTNGTIDFNAKHINMRLELGYRDALRAIRHYKLKQAGTPVRDADRIAEEEADFIMIKNTFKKEELQESIDSHMNTLNNILGKYGF